MPKEKSLRLRVANILGISNDSKEALVIYMLVDKIEVLEKGLAGVKASAKNLDVRTSGLKRYAGPRRG